MTWNPFSGVNAAYVFELYERYLHDPASVDAATRAFFERWTPPEPAPNASEAAAAPVMVTPDVAKVAAVVKYAQAIREYGHLAAQLDPLGSQPLGDPSLDMSSYGLTEDDLRRLPASLVGGVLASARNALDATELLRAIYAGSIGYDFDHIRRPEEREWLREAIESGRYSVRSQPLDSEALLQRLTEVEVFERFIHRIFPGKHRFSIEGLDIMVPMLDEIIALLADAGETNILIGMAHRGRLNVLAHTLGKSYTNIFAEFKDPVRKHRHGDDIGWMGDVKYHLGGRRAIKNGSPVDSVVTMAPNPSHLEFVNPVVEGMARAAGTDVGKRGKPAFDPGITQPILIHGDAAFPGQGIVSETLNLSQLPGYWTGGTLHIITNNQLGFTTNPVDSRSTLYASDLAKGFKIPVLHVNADDPEACIEAARIAFGYLAEFERDFVIDLIGYRRWGHNEGDEPFFTQPLMYTKIKNHPTVRQIWADTLVKRGVISSARAEDLVKDHNLKLQSVLEGLDPERDLIEPLPTPPVPKTARRLVTAIPVERLRELNRSLLTMPGEFNVHPKLAQAMQKRRDAVEKLDERVIDWATAEDLAVASVLEDGIAVRLTGQDVGRGTYSQRHAILTDQTTGDPFVPLQALPQARAAYEIYNSPLSEAAALGFEFGYNVQAPRRLVLWEPQYGDFDNGAQVIIDEFVVSARAKFGLTPSLVMLLPHGYEGAGPDHSSARLERFLQATADINMRVANPTTPAQYFHLLRRQALLLESDPLPLVVMTPKSLLRHPLVISSLNELAEGQWQPVIDDTALPAAVQRVILCSGKVYIDIVNSKARADHPEVALVRVEQLYPFPTEDLQPIFDRYTNATEVVWLQEEPENAGAWEFARPLLQDQLKGRLPLRYIGRPRNSSPAEGSATRHKINQEALIAQAFSVDVQESLADIIVR
ncbi:MAG: 2-oxoglutarate dehydrogenase E1 component [Chloroflexi bacterium]|nr:2-oxoglutarate dehydrogenase E1 component [Chloroflexota bacterium]